MRITSIFFILFLSLSAIGQDYWTGRDVPLPEKETKDVKFYGFFISQFVASNVFPTNDFLQGQTIGRLYGGNSTTTTDTSVAAYIEQRFIPFVSYQPSLLNKIVTLRVAFEIDFTWGDVSYGAGGNFGGAISADQVNLQTQQLSIEFQATEAFSINVGLQRLFDTPYNPQNTIFGKMVNSGFRLGLFGAEAVGITARYDMPTWRAKAGYYVLYENNIVKNDDVALFEINFEKELKKYWNIGVATYYIRDRSGGKGGVSILGQGFSGLLATYNGTQAFGINQDYKADVLWLGTYWNKNESYQLGRLMFTGYALANFGSIATNRENWQRQISIAGYSANTKLGYKYGQTADDKIETDLYFSSGDGSISDGKYGGVLTGNQWGAPGALMIGSGAYLLFPNSNVVNRYVAAVVDRSNNGLGLIGGTLNIHKDIIPHRLSAKAGTAMAASIVTPQNGNNYLGTEVNARLRWSPKILMDIELNGAYLFLGDFYESSSFNGGQSEKPVNPWMMSVVFKWLLF